jgi:glycosyltransferase involved in cell wall biosynthesis
VAAGWLLNKPLTIPQVSIVLPVRNAADTLDECLDSIAQQSFEHYEILVIDDGSSDGSVELVSHWAECDARIKLLTQPPLGLVAALNRGLSETKAPLIARMDADDVMYPQRLAKQVAYLAKHPDIDLVATQVRLFPDEKIQAGYAEYVRWQNSCLSPEEINKEIFVESPFAHPSVMFRCEVVCALGGYREGDFPEDYDLWFRLMQSGHRMAKLAEVLLDWRESEGRLSRIDPRCSREAFDRLRAKYLADHLRARLKPNDAMRTRPLVYWGAGRKTRRRSNLLIEKGFAPAAWVDIDERKIGNLLQDVPVVSPDWLGDQQKKPFVLSYVANHGARDDISQCLQAMGYRRGDDYLMVG